MSRTIIAFFSSDAREKYKGDVFRALALPQKYGIHFRYQTSWIHPQVLSKLETLKGQTGVIFYAQGNDLTIEKDRRQITNTSIRNVTIKDIYQDKNLDIVNFYLELNDFCDCTPHSNSSKDLLPPNGIVSEITVIDGVDNSWYGRVSKVKDSFKDTLFYFIDSIKQNNDTLQASYLLAKRDWQYELSEGSEYQVQISFYDPEDGENGLIVENSSNAVILEIPSGHKVAAPRDTIIFDIITQSLAQKNSRSHSKISIRTDTQCATPQIDLSVQIQWKIIRTVSSVMKFGALSVLAAMGVLGLSVAFKDLTGSSFALVNWGIAIASLIAIGCSASQLFNEFNKK
jgi:hypothetical protein